MFGKTLAAVVEISAYRISTGWKNPKAITVFKKLDPKWKKTKLHFAAKLFLFYETTCTNDDTQ